MTNKRRRAMLVLLLVLALLVTMPASRAIAADLSFDESGNVTNTTSLTFLAGPNNNTDYVADLLSAKVKVDLYKVADAVKETPAEGESSHGMMYVFKPVTGFSSLTGIDTYAGLRALDIDGWMALAQTAAGTVKGGSFTPAYSFTADQTGAATAAQNVAAGLYLVVAHDNALPASQYWTTDSSGKIVTIADSEEYEYTYLPELIALPTTVDHMGVAGTDAAGNPIATHNPDAVSTAGGNWQAQLTAMLKPTREHRYGNLVVVKTVTSYNNLSPVTFTFYVTATFRGKEVYKNYISLSFNAAGTKEYQILDAIPVGAEVTVTEVYAGSSYTLTADPEYTTIVYAEDIKDAAHVYFSNSYDGYVITGYGIENTFTSNGSTWIMTKTEIPWS